MNLPCESWTNFIILSKLFMTHERIFERFCATFCLITIANNVIRDATIWCRCWSWTRLKCLEGEGENVTINLFLMVILDIICNYIKYRYWNDLLLQMYDIKGLILIFELHIWQMQNEKNMFPTTSWKISWYL